MWQKINEEDNKIVVERKDLSTKYMIISLLLLMIVVIGAYILICNQSKEIIVGESTIGLLLIVSIICIFAKSKPYTYITFDKDLFIIEGNGMHKQILTTKIVKFEAFTSDGNGYSSNGYKYKGVRIRYLDDSNKNKETRFQLEENEKFEKIANELLKKFKKAANVHLVEDEINEEFEKLDEDEEINVIFVGKTKYGKKEKKGYKLGPESKLVFVTEDYVPMTFELRRSTIDLDKIEEYKKYTVKYGYGINYIFKEVKSNKKVDTIRVNQAKKEIEKDGDEVISDISKIKEELAIEKRRGKQLTTILLSLVVYILFISFVCAMSEEDSHYVKVAAIGTLIYLIVIIGFIIAKLLLKKDYAKIYQDEND